MATLLANAGLYLRKMNPGIPETQGESKVIAAWFVDPGQTALEFVLSLVWLAHFLWAGTTCLTDWTYDPKAQRELDSVDVIVGVIIAVHIITITYYKVTTSRTWFLLQPCNVWVFGLTFLHFSRSAAAAWSFNMYLHVMFGSWVGLLGADLRDYTNPIEIINFFTLHFAIVLAPVYHIVRGTFPIYSADIYGCGTMFIMYHMVCCLPLSILSGWNLDYVMCPPKQAVKLGQTYRCVLFPSFYLGCILMRLGLVSALLWVLGR